MNWFRNDVGNDASLPKPSDVAPKLGSGAEQDRLGSHFSFGSSSNGGLGEATEHAARKASSMGHEAKDATKRALDARGNGAEQDRYGGHFTTRGSWSGFGGPDPVQTAVQGIQNAKDKATGYNGWFGLGHDGQQRVKYLAMKGDGGEQVSRRRPTSLAEFVADIQWGSGDPLDSLGVFSNRTRLESISVFLRALLTRRPRR
ncbi:hypothetical protein BDV95DRAFT_574210 [Massariosphaeria phaeospora]|uniref:Uncharacterized protein n=1 Tax=Massariosphaeria phaeospora TaxID=100035 RepID=A0A7C8MMK3_9PLEO|nr:hypothetical protein BDV95DRAFT_574210 [Massariosphaeria phaeospora]